MKQLFNTLCAVLLCSTILGCSSGTDSDDTGGGNNVTVASGKVTWQIGGETKIASGMATRLGKSGGVPVVSILGNWDGQGPMYQANLSIYDAKGPAKFDIITGTPAIPGNASATINHNGVSRVAIPGTGNVTITKMEGKLVQGTFTFKTMNINGQDTLEVTGGQFNLDFVI